MHFFLHDNRQLLLGVFLIISLTGCNAGSEAQKIVDLAIEAQGGQNYNNVFIEFDFRNRHYTITKKDGIFEYTRAFDDSLGRYKDVYSNEGFYRMLNGEKIVVPDTMAVKYTNSVNSVVYYATTPFVLNDPSVVKKYLGLCSIKNQKYHKIEIRFKQEGGGNDFDDVYVYWFNKETRLMDYFAYKYYTDGGGTRFREIYNKRWVGDILFSDHYNYQYDSKDTPIHEFDQLYEDNQLELLSKIELENVKVSSLN